MKKKLSPTLITFIREACYKVFWYKNDLADFLKLHDVPESKIFDLKDKTKAVFLSQLFYDLSRSENPDGQEIMYRIGMSLIEMSSFPALERLEDSKIKIVAARAAISDLNPHMHKVVQYFNEEERREDIQRREQLVHERKSAFYQKLEFLKNELEKLGKEKLGTPDGGYAFEKWLYELFILFDITTRKSYREPGGRQIDMAISLDGNHYIVEAKFTIRQVNVSDIDSLYGRLRKLADGTKGLIISMSGFDNNAIRQASSDRTWILMMDYSHIYNLILNHAMELSDVIRRIHRNASQVGESFLALEDF